MAHFAVLLEHGPPWNQERPLREQAGWDEHATFMDALAADGFVQLGGPVGEDGERVLLIVHARSRREVERRLELDPWAGADMLRVVSIEPYDILLRHG
jgi:uncharacterized protein YciI